MRPELPALRQKDKVLCLWIPDQCHPAHAGLRLHLQEGEPEHLCDHKPQPRGHPQGLLGDQRDPHAHVQDHTLTAARAHPEADVMVNFASFRSAFETTMEALDEETIRTVAVIAEGVPERRPGSWGRLPESWGRSSSGRPQWEAWPQEPSGSGTRREPSRTSSPPSYIGRAVWALSPSRGECSTRPSI